MSAPSLPAGVVGPTRADFRTAAQTAQFVTVYTSPAEAWVWQTSGRQFLMDLNSALGRRREAIFSADAFSELRERLRAAGVDVSQVSASAWDRETLRAALWYAYRNGFAAAGTTPGNIWLPSSLEPPPLGVVIAGTDTPRPPPTRLVPARGTSTTTSGPTAAQRQAARDLDAYARSTTSLRSNVRDATVEGYQRAMGGVTVDGKYGADTRARMIALGVASPAPVPPAASSTVEAGAMGGAKTSGGAILVMAAVGTLVGAAVYLGERDRPKGAKGAAKVRAWSQSDERARAARRPRGASGASVFGR